MIWITLKNGERSRVEGFRVYFRGWNDYEWYCHQSHVNEGMWAVSEITCGYAVTGLDYPTPEKAIAATQQCLNGRWKEVMAERLQAAIERTRAQMGRSD